ncbi:aldolase [Sphingomonas sp. Leaf357]|uniref:HPr kinase/phosphorylase n=1 Tax=Sphingomonas sp. Leaf357 TaxID=1736350 RepID=UPI0006FFEF4E|nr:HPr kinase/phosphatase C-terminal domain-containing protein [Sphingomonas sp. Leaf357]KQS04892.1 aldolase [Sphingomonas sp. Leaf357]
MTDQTLTSETLHATAVAIGSHAVLIEGPSGAGKSDLALRLIDRGAVLISDDRTILQADNGTVRATAPRTIAGRIEVRGIGILPMQYAEGVEVALLVRLTDAVERMPLETVERRIAGIVIPEIALDAREPSAPIKVELALKRQIA